MGNRFESSKSRSVLNPSRGFGFALLFGAAGFVTPILLMLAVTAVQWGISGSRDLDRAYDLMWLKTHLPYPASGTGLVFGATGWAWGAPVGSYRFTPTLVIVFAISLPMWFVLKAVVESFDPQPRVKGGTIESPVEASLVTMLAIPPMATALLLAGARAAARRKGPPDPELA
jgi:hypothetical protein